MKNLHSVRLIYRTEETAFAVYLKEFWMFCGVYVREYVSDMQHKELPLQRVDLNIIIGGCDYDKKKLLADDEMNLSCIEYEKLNDEKQKCDFVFNVKKTMKKKLDEAGVGNSAEFLKLFEIFAKNNYALKNYWGHVLQSVMQSDMLTDLQNMYIACMNELWTSIDSDEELYSQYTYLNCARKYEQICRIKNERGYFSTTKLMEKAKSLMVKEPKFTLANALAGVIGLNDNLTWIDGEQYLLSAIHGEKTQRHVGFLYYILAHFYEYQIKDMVKTKGLYEKMYQIVPENYRVIYKIACENYRNGSENVASQYFSDIYNEMYKKAETGYIQPLEILYYYKCAKILLSMGTKAIDKVLVPLKIESIDIIWKENIYNHFVNHFFEISKVFENSKISEDSEIDKQSYYEMFQKKINQY